MSRLLHPLVAALMLLLFALSAPSLFDQLDSVSVAPQIAGNIAGHLPGPTEKRFRYDVIHIYNLDLIN